MSQKIILMKKSWYLCDIFLDVFQVEFINKQLLCLKVFESKQLRLSARSVNKNKIFSEPQKRPPRLKNLRGQTTFSKTISSNEDQYYATSTSKANLPRQMSHQDRRTLMTPKRKCSFSSFSECRYVVDGGKTTTFLFSIETPSPSKVETVRRDLSL